MATLFFFKCITKEGWREREREEARQELRSTVLSGLPYTTYSQTLSHYCSARELLPAAFPPWAGTFLIIEPGAAHVPVRRPC